MTGRSFLFHRLDAFVAGTVGEPGSRIFYIQARSGDEIVSLRLEKEQVGMLGQYLCQLAQSMGATEPAQAAPGLVEPVTAEWVVGALSVGIDEENGLIFVTAEELEIDDGSDEYVDDDLDDGTDELDTVDPDPLDDPDVASAQFALQPGQAIAFADAAMDLVRAGRRPCPLCGRPMGPSTHSCPRWN